MRRRVATHRTTELAEAVLEIGGAMHRQAERLSAGPLTAGEQLGLAFKLNRQALALNGLSEELRRLRGKGKPAPPDQEHGAGLRMAG